MNPLDASFLALENARNPMHVGNVAILDGPVPSYGEVVRMVAGKLSQIPRYRQKVRGVPLQLHRPLWVDDPHFQILYHIRHTAVPRPGGENELRNLAGRIFAQSLDRSKPLWEMWIVEGLEANRWALINKMHHCMVDGAGATDLLHVLLDHSPEVQEPVLQPWAPADEPGNLGITIGGLLDGLVQPLQALRGLSALARSPMPGGKTISDVGRSAWAYGSLAFGRTVNLNGPIGPHRRWSWAKSSLADIKTIRRALGGTVNDVVLAAITRGFRELLVGRGADLEGRVVRTLVPVSVRTEAERGVHNNRVSSMFAGLPVGIEDPEACLLDIRRQMDGLKASKMAIAGDRLIRMSGFAPPMLVALGTRLATRLPQRIVNTVTTNVPGPQIPLFIRGRRMVEVYPYVPIQGEVRIAVVIFSYLGALTFGVTGDYDTTPDIEVLTQGIGRGVHEYLRIAQAVTAPLALPAPRTNSAIARTAKPGVRQSPPLER